MCEFFSKLGVVFSTAELIKLEYSPGPLRAILVSPFPLSLLMCFFTYVLCWFRLFVLLSSFAGMMLNVEKRRQLVVVTLQLKAALGPSIVDDSTPSAPTPVD